MSTTIVWLRQDLRLDDNPALFHATESGAEVIAVYIWAPEEEGSWMYGGASKVWLHFSLQSLCESFKNVGSDLIIRKGNSLEELLALAKRSNASTIHWNDRYEPETVARDQKIREVLEKSGLNVKTFNSTLLYDPGSISTLQNGCYRVFTPFWKRCLEVEPIAPLPIPKRLKSPEHIPASLSLESLELLPHVHWDSGIRSSWSIGEAGGREQLNLFRREIVQDYDHSRNIPSRPGTSKMSPYLHFGEISVRRVWSDVQHDIKTSDKAAVQNQRVYLRELAWREFAYYTLIASPESAKTSWKPDFEKLPTIEDEDAFAAWKKGETGFPLVDAGMRELWTTGWMHNRVRMIVGSFLTKDLLIYWKAGADWFWDTLVDADLANNTMGWQWVAGTGVDAMPYIRVFNPVTQGEKFDPKGEYIRRWVPELKGLSDKTINQPWSASADELKRAGVILGKTYPKPIVDHSSARKRALEAYASIKQRT